MMKINKKILLGAAIAMASAHQASAVPFAPSDARAMGMGGVGVASSEIASAPRYNPALLANTREDDHFGLKLPQFSVIVADDDGFIDEVEDFDEESELATPGSGSTNVDLLSNVLDEATGALGLEKMSTALSELAAAKDLPTNNAQDIIDKENAYSAAQTKLTEASNYLDGRLFSTDNTVSPDLVLYSGAIADDLDDLNDKALRINGGINTAVAVPSKKFSLALSLGGQVTMSGRINVSGNDTAILRNYPAAVAEYLELVNTLQQRLVELDVTDSNSVQAVQDAQVAVDGFDYGLGDGEGGTAIFENGQLSSEAENSNLQSTVEMIGVAVADVGLTAARTFNIKGHDISFGITPKLQTITVFDYSHDIDGKDEFGNPVEFSADDATENTEEYSAFNIDLGAAYQFGAEKQWQAGFTIQNLLGGEYESSNYISSNGLEGTIVSISPMARVGISHQTNWTKVAVDLDLTENDPVAFEDPTQYAAIGAEFNLFRTLQLRAGYRANLAGTDQDIVTAGIGLSPLAVHLDIGVMANASDPEKEAGIAFEFGVEF